MLALLWLGRSSRHLRPAFVPEMVLEKRAILEERSLAGSIAPFHADLLKGLQPMVFSNHSAADAWVPLALVSENGNPIADSLPPGPVGGAEGRTALAAPLADFVGVVAIYDHSTSSPYTYFVISGTFNNSPSIAPVAFQEITSILTGSFSLTQNGVLYQTMATQDYFTQADFYGAGPPTNTIILGDNQTMSIAVQRSGGGSKWAAISDDLLQNPSAPGSAVKQNYDLYTYDYNTGQLNQFSGGAVNYNGSFYLQFTPPTPHPGDASGTTLYFQGDGITVMLNVNNHGLYATYNTLSGIVNYSNPNFTGGTVDFTFSAQNVPEPPNAANHVQFYTENTIAHMGAGPGYSNSDGLTWKYNIGY
jgi:hypothetical protein